MIIHNLWWEKPPTFLIFLNEYQLYNLSSINQTDCVKKKLLCGTKFTFYEDSEESLIQKCRVTIKDSSKKICFTKTYNQIDNINRNFYTLQYVFKYDRYCILISVLCSIPFPISKFVTEDLSEKEYLEIKQKDKSQKDITRELPFPDTVDENLIEEFANDWPGHTELLTEEESLGSYI